MKGMYEEIYKWHAKKYIVAKRSFDIEKWFKEKRLKLLKKKILWTIQRWKEKMKEGELWSDD
jgi:hypothetical protein